MPYRPKKAVKAEKKPGEFHGDARERQRSDQRFAQMATRSTLSRLRNRKSDAK